MADWFVRGLPPLVFQPSTDEWICWAAAMESWLRVTPNRKVRTRDELVGLFQGDTDDSGALLKKGLPRLITMARMDVKAFPKSGPGLSLDFLYQKLVERGHLYLMFSSSGVGHANVVYAVDEELDYIGYMDPWPGMGYRSRSIGDFRDAASEFLVGWPSRY
ncbi:MAG TPA: papain-like cysteine protease family protein [Thermoanaerobaculia bacterium]|nr:papain-like cysteine protease family protein [Thermoanaerobaculia bacterium]